MKTCLVGLVVGLSLASSARVGAEVDSSQPPVVVSPEFINRLAGELRSQHPALRAAAARTAAAQANVAAVRSWQDPVLVLGGLGAEDNMRAEEGDILYGIEQKLPLFGKVKRARQLAREDLAAEQADAEYQFQVRRAALARGLFQAALAQREAEIGEEDLQWLDTMARAAEERYRVGESAQSYVLRIANERARRRSQLLTDRQRVGQVLGSVNRLLNRDLASPWPLLRLPPVAGSVAYTPQLARLAVANEPRLKLLRQQVRRAEAAADVARRQKAPDLSLGAEARHYSGDGEFRQAMVTLNISLPWVNGSRYRQDIVREEAKREAADWDARDYENGLREDLWRLTVDLDAARREAVLYRDEILPRANEALASAMAPWTTGRGMFYDVMEARRAWLEAKVTFARAVATQYQLLTELTLCCGLGDLEALMMIGAEPEPVSPSAPKP